MTLEAVLITLLVGAIAGWLATMLLGHWGFGLLFNIVIGVLGGLVGAWLLPKIGLNVGSGLIAAIFSATLGAILILLAIIGLQRVGAVPMRRRY